MVYINFNRQICVEMLRYTGFRGTDRPGSLDCDKFLREACEECAGHLRPHIGSGLILPVCLLCQSTSFFVLAFHELTLRNSKTSSCPGFCVAEAASSQIVSPHGYM